MEKQILNNKIGIQIMLIITGVTLVILGLLCCILSYGYFTGSGYSYSFNGYFNSSFYVFIGIGIFFIGITLIIISSIKIANYSIIKKSAKSPTVSCETTTPRANANTNNVDYIRNKIASLQQMRAEGLISEAEYDNMKSSVIKNSGCLL